MAPNEPAGSAMVSSSGRGRRPASGERSPRAAGVVGSLLIEASSLFAQRAGPKRGLEFLDLSEVLDDGAGPLGRRNST